MGEFYDAFLTGGIALCALMIPVWLLRLKKRGATAYLMSSAFAVMGLLLSLLKFDAARSLVILCGIVLVLLLGADVAVRSSEQFQRETKGSSDAR